MYARKSVFTGNFLAIFKHIYDILPSKYMTRDEDLVCSIYMDKNKIKKYRKENLF